MSVKLQWPQRLAWSKAWLDGATWRRQWLSLLVGQANRSFERRDVA